MSDDAAPAYDARYAIRFGRVRSSGISVPTSLPPKACSRCKLVKAADQFHWRKPGISIQSRCKACYVEIHAEWYEQNTDLARRRCSRNKSNAIKWLRAQKTGPCVDCGGRFHAAAMDFDHVESGKIASLAWMAGRGWSLEAMRKEIAKCELVCANCHRVRTHMRREAVTERRRRGPQPLA